jgi:hypothetical protein
MTGSSLAPIVIPIAAMASLAAWLFLVYHAAAHPEWGRGKARQQHAPQPVALAGRPVRGRPLPHHWPTALPSPRPVPASEHGRAGMIR